MRITPEHGPGSVLLHVTGRLTSDASARLHLALTTQLATGAAVLIDLSGLVLDRSAALDLALRGRPRNVRARFCLPGRPTAGVVGDLVTNTVAPWGLDPLDATLAAAGSAQLVGRASEHGCDLVIEHDGRYLHLRVTDHHAPGRHGPDGPTAVHRVALRTGRGAPQEAEAQEADA